MKHYTLLALLLIFGSVHAAEPLLIDKPGQYPISEKEQIGIEQKENTLSLLRLSTKGGVTLKVAPGWKMYSDTPGVLWFYNGDIELIRMEFRADGLAFEESARSAELWNEAPKAFVALLPKNRLRPLPKP
jgi:hypothetical protein